MSREAAPAAFLGCFGQVWLQDWIDLIHSLLSCLISVRTSDTPSCSTVGLYAACGLSLFAANHLLFSDKTVDSYSPGFLSGYTPLPRLCMGDNLDVCMGDDVCC